MVLESRPNRWFEQGGMSAQYSYLNSLCSTALGLVSLSKGTSDRITALERVASLPRQRRLHSFCLAVFSDAFIARKSLFQKE